MPSDVHWSVAGDRPGDMKSRPRSGLRPAPAHPVRRRRAHRRAATPPPGRKARPADVRRAGRGQWRGGRPAPPLAGGGGGRRRRRPRTPRPPPPPPPAGGGGGGGAPPGPPPQPPPPPAVAAGAWGGPAGSRPMRLTLRLAGSKRNPASVAEVPTVPPAITI